MELRPPPSFCIFGSLPTLAPPSAAFWDVSGEALPFYPRRPCRTNNKMPTNDQSPRGSGFLTLGLRVFLLAFDGFERKYLITPGGIVIPGMIGASMTTANG